jgi:NAD(P)-dependent dehydrogenase (short-subunit alcohol dehydrogenase family)
MPIVDFSLDGKIALITGGSKGIGRSIALAFAEHGADVAIAARGAEALERTRKEIEERGRRALAVPTDLGNPREIEQLHAKVREELGDVDVLVNNAGTGEAGGLATVPREQFDLVVKLNLWAPLRLAQLCYWGMKEKGGGVVINITSNDGLRPSAGVGAYGATKAALVNLTKQMAMEWSGDGIRAVSIAPGLVRTELAEPLVAYYESQGMELNLLRRVGEPEDIAGLALFLASEAGRFATAETFVLDGGELNKGHQL